jgi:hypothetical protein
VALREFGCVGATGTARLCPKIGAPAEFRKSVRQSNGREGAMRAPRRRIATLALVGLVVGACADSPPTTAPPPVVRHFERDNISFEYPGNWGEAQFEVVSSFSSAVVFLSTSPLSDPCDRRPNSIECVRSAVAALAPNGLLVEWSTHGFPGWTFDPAKGRLILVGGRRATLEDVEPGDDCRRVEGDRSIVVTVDDGRAPGNWLEMRACLRGPSLDVLRAQIQAMVATVRW